MIYFLAGVILTLAAITRVARGDDQNEVTIEPSARRVEIRAALLKYTPLGSSPKQVLDFIEHRLHHEKTPAARIQAKPAESETATDSGKRGVKRIKIDLADYLANPGLLLLPIPMPLQSSLWVQWAFDKQDRLIEIFVDRHPQ
jgi:hypothetical protein